MVNFIVPYRYSCNMYTTLFIIR